MAVAPAGGAHDIPVAHKPVMDLERNKAIVREFDEPGNGTGDLGRLEELCTPDMLNHALAPGRPAGLAGTRQFLQARHRRRHPARWIESHIVAEGDLVVQRGRREDLSTGGTFRGFDVPAGVYTRDAAFACRLADGRITERRAIRDDLAMLVQLGALQPNAG
jgi:ketosteroid isomerase-like protein